MRREKIGIAGATPGIDPPVFLGDLSFPFLSFQQFYNYNKNNVTKKISQLNMSITAQTPKRPTKIHIFNQKISIAISTTKTSKILQE